MSDFQKIKNKKFLRVFFVILLLIFFITPFGQSLIKQIFFASADEINYYFNSYDTGDVWATNPANMVDGTETSYASTATAGDTQTLNASTADGSFLGTITKVEIRAYAYRSAGTWWIELMPVFGGNSNGDSHTVSLDGTPSWKSYIDITNDTNAPGTWTWSDVQNLDVQVLADKGSGSGTVYCGEVEIRVTYTGTTVNQASYRIFSGDDSTQVGIALGEEDTVATTTETNQDFRLRLVLDVSYNDLATSSKNYKLQFAERSGTCDTSFVGETYADVTATSAIAFKDNATPSDGDAITATTTDPDYGGNTLVYQTYEEANNFTVVNNIPYGDSGIWDFSLTDLSATPKRNYCFRVVESDDTPLDTYTVIPELSIIGPTISQSAYRFFENDNSTTVNTALNTQDTSATTTAMRTPFRLRLNMHVANSDMIVGASSYKLQYAERSGVCDTSFTGESYIDVTANSAIAFYDNPLPSDGDTLTTTTTDPVHSGHTNVAQTYEEENNFTATSTVSAGEDGLWDFSLFDNTSYAGSAYCFRVVESDGTLLDIYDQIPEIEVHTPALEQSAYRWFENRDEVSGEFGDGGVVTGASASAVAFSAVIYDSYIYIGGYDSSSNWRIEKRSLASGSLDTGFGSSGIVSGVSSSSRIYSIVADDTYLYAVGYDDTPDWRIEKRNLSDGSLDTGFGTSGVVTGSSTSYLAYAAAIDSNYIYITGVDENMDWRIEKRSLSDGSLDTSFGTSGVVTGDNSSGSAHSIVVDLSYMYVTGSDSGINWRIEKRSLSDGSLDTGFGSSGVVTGNSASDYARAIDIDSNYMYITGEDENDDWRIEKRSLSDGSLIENFGTNGVVTGDSSSYIAYSLKIDGSHMYVAGDDFSNWRIEKRSLSDGSLIENFGTNGVVTGDSSSDYSRSISIDSSYMYIVGTDQGNDWRIEKRELFDGSLDMGEVSPGGVLANQDTLIIPPDQQTPFRLRLAAHNSSNLVATSSMNFKLQYAESSGNCDTSFVGETYTDVGTSSGLIRYYDNSTSTDGMPTLATSTDPSHSGHTNILQTYAESNSYIRIREAISQEEDGLWDFSLVDYAGIASTSYCFRLVESGGDPLSSYSQIPEITIQGPTQTQAAYRFFENDPGLKFGIDGVVTGDTASNVARSVAIDNPYMYVVGHDGSDWRIEKRNLSDGFLDSGFGTSGVITGDSASTGANSVAIDSTYMYVAGYDGTTDWRIEKRSLSDGSLDSGFGTSGVVTGDSASLVANSVAIDSTYMYVAGYDGNDWRIEKRSLSDGSLDSGFGTSGVITGDSASYIAYSVAIDSTYMYVAGYDGSDDWRIEKRSLSDGSLDSGFGTSGVVTGDSASFIAYSVAIDSSYMYVAGYDGTTDWRIEKRSLSDGSLDSGFGTSGVITGDSSSNIAYSIAIDSTYMYVAGYDALVDWRIEKRSLSDGSLDANFGTSGVVTGDSNSQVANSIAIDSTYMYVVGYDGIVDWRIEKRRLNDGLLDDGSSVYIASSLALQDTGIDLNNFTTETDPFRLRFLTDMSGADIYPNAGYYKLQFAEKGGGTCASPSDSWSDVSTTTGFSFYDNLYTNDSISFESTSTDPTYLGHTIVTQTYQESNNFYLKNLVQGGESALWDFPLYFNNANYNSSYCFRMVHNDGTELDSYLSYPAVVTPANEPTPVYYSVGQTTDDLQTSTSTVSISSGVATFSVAQTGNIGVGDRITFGAASTTVYISGKIDTSNWNVVTATGTIPADVTTETVGSITREYTSLSAAEAGAGDSNHIGTTSLVSADIQLNLALYYDTGADTTAVTIDGWKTSSTTYIKIYTPNNTATEANINQRHDGVWDDGKYSLDSTGYTLNINSDAEHTIINGMQIKNSGTAANTNAIEFKSDNTVISNNIIFLPAVSDNVRQAVYDFWTSGSIIYNNIIYCSGGGSQTTMLTLRGEGSRSVFNNTVISNGVDTGIEVGGTSVLLYNNISLGSNFDYGGHNGGVASLSSSNNISSDATATGTNSITNATVMFQNEAGNDFRLHSDDTTARDAGTSTSVIASVSEAIYDIQGTARGGAWDIGADELPVDFVSTICENTSAGGDCANLDYSTLSAWEDAVESDLTAETTRVFSGTLSGTLSENNLVELYRTEIDTGIDGYVVAHTANGQILIDGITGTTTPLIAESGDQWRYNDSTSTMWTVLGTGDELGASPRAVAKIDGSWVNADTNEVTVDEWNTDSDNSIKIYTTNLARHGGKWKENSYRLVVNSAWGRIFTNYENYISIDGLQLEQQGSYEGESSGLYNRANNSDSNVEISNNIIKNTHNLGDNGTGIRVISNIYSAKVKVWNNIIYGFYNGVVADNFNSYSVINFYNNTILEFNGHGVWLASDIIKTNTYVSAYNNIVQGTSTNYNLNSSEGSNISTSINNISSDDSSPNTEFRNITVDFISTSTQDFHLAKTDTGAKDKGLNLSNDQYINFSTDIDGASRTSGEALWSIGADEVATPIYRSVGPSRTTSIASGSSNAMSISSTTATFASALADNIGVGDVIQYDSNNNGVIDALAFIHGRASSTEYSVREVDGGFIASTTTVADNDWAIYRAYTSLSNAEAGIENTGINSTLRNFDSWTGGRDLITNNEQWNITLYANGTTADTTVVTIQDWNTGEQNYLKVYTPVDESEVGVSQRHNGAWDDYKYRIVNNQNNSEAVVRILDSNIYIDGILVSKEGNNTFYDLVGIRGTDTSDNINISNNIIRNISTGTGSIKTGIYYTNEQSNLIKANIFNNIVYGFKTGIYISGSSGIKVFNNTAYNNSVFCYFTFYESYRPVFINNIAQNCGNGFAHHASGNSHWNSNNRNNLSDLSDDAPGEGSINNATVRFNDEASYDFHLHPLDTVAKNAGTSTLSLLDTGCLGDTQCLVSLSKDIDGHTRNADGQGWDIGADEAANFVAYSVGQTTDNLMGGLVTTVTISNGAGTFSVAQTGNIGVGDRVTYDTDKIAYISSKESTSAWNLVTATGTTPVDITDSTVVSITREYTSLSAAESGATDSNHLNTADIKTSNIQLNFPAYYDSGPDTDEVAIDGFTTGQPNFIKIYTPNNTATEVNINQRHQGIWDENKYIVVRTGYNIDYSPFRVFSDFTKISGMQVEYGNAEEYSYGVGIGLYASASIDSNIIRRTGSIGLNTAIPFSSSPAGSTIKIFNNIIYDFGSGIYSEERWSTDYHFAEIYNNTVINSGSYGIRVRYNTGNGEKIYLNNNIVDSVDGDYFVENINSSNNISSDQTAPGTNSITSATVKFLDEKNNDFRLSPDDTVAKNAGVDLSTSTPPAGGFAFNSDIVGHIRPSADSGQAGAWDIGASEAANRIYRSVGPGNTLPLATGTSNALSITDSTATFANSLPLNIGVGDAIQYDSNDDGTVDSIAFIHERNTNKIYTIKNVDGLTPTSTIASDNDWAIYRAYTSLANAEAGTENTGIDATLRAFESWSGGKDIFSSNEQWNIVAYADGTESNWQTIQGWTTGQQNYLRIYTPYKEGEVGITQRHSGVWDDGTFNIKTTRTAFDVYDDNVRIDGIQIQITAADIRNGVEYTRQRSGNIYISNNIFEKLGGQSGTGVTFGNPSLDNYANAYIYNNIIYGFANGVGGYDTTLKKYFYNNTVYNCGTGFRPYAPGNTFVLKNNIAYNNSNNYGTYGSGYDNMNSDYNISGPGADGDMPGLNSLDGVTVAFRNASSSDFRLDPYDTNARNAGIDLTNDPYLWFEHDIKGVVRDGDWDIGADEATRVTIQPSVEATHYNKEIGLSEGLIGYWTFDGPDIDWENNIIMDRSGNYNNGIATGSPKAVPGKYGQAFEFDGVDDYIDITGNFPNGNSERTISFWFNANSYDVSTYDSFFSYDYFGNNGQDFEIGAEENAVSVSFYGHTVITPKGNLKTDEWYHVSVVIPSGASLTSDVLVYINGEVQSLSDEAGDVQTLNTNNSTIQLGDRNVTDMHYDGKLDEVRIYNRALSQTEVGFLYRWGQTHLQTSQKEYHKKGLVGYWSFDGPDMDWASTTAEVLDRSEYGNHGDLLGPTAKPGRLGQGLYFDGENDSIQIPDSPSLRMSSEMTISTWLKYNGFSGYKFILEKGYGDVDNYSLHINWGSLKFELYDTAFRSVDIGSVPSGEWIHLLVNYSDSNNEFRTYINGDEVAGSPFATNYSLNNSITSDLYIGRQGWSGDTNPTSAYFPGMIDEVRIYNYTLTEQEIKSLYGSGKVEIRP